MCLRNTATNNTGAHVCEACAAGLHQQVRKPCVRELQHLPKIGKGLCVILLIVGGESLPDHTQHPRCTCEIKITQRRKTAVRGEDVARTGDEGGA